MPYLLCRRLGRQLSATLSEDNEDAPILHASVFREQFSFRRNHTTEHLLSRALGTAQFRVPCRLCCCSPLVVTHKGGRPLPDYDFSTFLLTRIFQTIYNSGKTGEKREAMRV